jgi:sugar transferase (PEP-CTERM system associated)
MIRLARTFLGYQLLQQVLFDVLVPIFTLAGIALLLPGAAMRTPAAAAEGLSLAAGVLFVNAASGLYQPPHGRAVGQSYARAALALLFAVPLTYVLFVLLDDQGTYDDSVRWVAMICVGMVIAHRAYVASTGSRARPASRILIYGTGAAAWKVGQLLKSSAPRSTVVGYYAGACDGESAVPAHLRLRGQHTLKDCAAAHRVDEIVVALSERRGGSMPLAELLDCRVSGVRVYDTSTLFEKLLGQIRIENLYPGWLIFGAGFQQGLARTLSKRAFDVLCATALLVATLPVVALTVIAIALESRGPVLYRQQRVGLAGHPFRVLKFRSMVVNAEAAGQPQWAKANDCRVTRVGAFIRRYRIDELPQLLNVLLGDMSLVGPRPERPFFVEQLTREVPFYGVRHSVKPGITGWAQVRYQYGATVEDAVEKLQYDLYYIKNHSLFVDIAILFETVGVVLSGKGAR